MVTTDDEALAERMRVMSLHGISKDAWKRYTAQGSWYYEILAPGFKYNMTDLAAAMGREQLRRQAQFQDARERIARRYSEAFSRLDEVRCPMARLDREHAWHLYVVELDASRLRITRNEFIDALKHVGIGTSVHFIPLHLHPFYRDRVGYVPEQFPNALSAFERIVSLPIYPAMSAGDVDDVIAAVSRIVERSRRRAVVAVPFASVLTGAAPSES
jgi:perosamine synthetase